MKKHIPVLLCGMLLGCSSSESIEPETELVGAKFGSMQECLASIQKTSGYELVISNDEPDSVYGRLHSTNLSFSCDKENTGSQGTYYLGSYEKPKDQPKPPTPKPSFEVFAADAYYDSYKKEGWSKLYDLIGDEGVARLKDLEPKAVKFAYTNPLCNKVQYNGVSMERTTKDEIVIFMDCDSPSDGSKANRIYISESEAKAAEAAKTQP